MSTGRPEIHRSGLTPLDPDHIETEKEVGHRAPRDEPGGGAVPEENRPGHHPEHEQDKPDLDAFAERFGTADHDADDEGSENRGARGRDERTRAGASDAEATSRDAGRATADSGPGTRPGEAAPPTSRTAVDLAVGAVGAAGKVAGPVLGALRDAAARALGSQGGEEQTADEDRLSRLENRVAELERRLDQAR